MGYLFWHFCFIFSPFSRVLNRKNTIKTSQLLRTGNGMSDFNSIKVRLKHTSLCDKSKAFLSFQFHKGTIKTQTGCKESKSCLIDFNSIKVRLKLNWTSEEEGLKVFQFHKGTIKTDILREGETPYAQFQFHKGTIKTCWRHKLEYYSSEISIP